VPQLLKDFVSSRKEKIEQAGVVAGPEGVRVKPVMLVVLLVFSALGVTASLMSTGMVKRLLAMEPFGGLLIAATKLLPYLLTIVAFAITYSLVPNTRVRPDAALIGALVSGGDGEGQVNAVSDARIVQGSPVAESHVVRVPPAIHRRVAMVLLRGKQDKRELVMFIGPFEAQAIATPARARSSMIQISDSGV
jgi:hypothetical protein